MTSQYKRILLKISGEALMGDQKFGIDKAACQKIAKEIAQVCAKKIQVGVVVGGGNIFRGNMAKEFGFDRTPADHIGMLGTVINGLVLQQCLSSIGVETRVMSALSCDAVVEDFRWTDAQEYLKKGIVVIFSGGSGNPYFTTDTAGALRASEMDCEILLKGTKVDGVYDKDPLKHKGAVRYQKLTYSEVLTKKLNVMDATAIALCRENKIPICVFNLFETGALLKAISGKVGSLVAGE